MCRQFTRDLLLQKNAGRGFVGGAIYYSVPPTIDLPSTSPLSSLGFDCVKVAGA